MHGFVQLWLNPDDVSKKLPKAMEAAFAHPASDGEAEIKALIDASTAVQKARFEPELFRKRTRLVKAERKLAAKVTEAARPA